jgi:hypothetical protein
MKRPHRKTQVEDDAETEDESAGRGKEQEAKKWQSTTRALIAEKDQNTK